MKKRSITYLSILVSSFILWGALEAIAQQYRLTVERRGEGSGAVSDNRRHTYDEGAGPVLTPGTKITLKAEADQDSFFEGWEGGGCSGAKTCTVTMDSDVSVTAVFGTADKVPKITVPTFLDFGKVKIKKSKTQTLTIGNAGTGNLIGSVSFSSGGGRAFTMNGNGFTLRPKGKKSVRVVFKPSVVGVQQATLRVDSNDPNLPVAFVVLQGEGVCDKDKPVVGDWELKISLDQHKVAPGGSISYSGTGTIPLEIHTCPGAQNGVQAVGEGQFDVTLHAVALECQEDGTIPQAVVISPAGSGTTQTLFIEINLPTTFYHYQLCCPQPIGCQTIDAEYGDYHIFTEIAFQDGATVTIPLGAADEVFNLTLTLNEILPPLPQ